MVPFVGWVERSDTHQLSEHGDGYRVAPPILLLKSVQIDFQIVDFTPIQYSQQLFLPFITL
jgi:hypothetical protein